ncbi:phospholipase A2 inhibitor and Ly6/PLAUR domain-containing protein-like isoform X2 [Brienomyrus brachyistius]|uniref:phospholipase A2 inhibitor and Ly6/PLAUR domain-containing protein-like isoform X2 n=1 Tax=Brienomyrus brachyistius TaxID=42636 RepID=UPI0020B3BE7D|nr:phospholipase A2 inhibitor and Ly6/PLAUR domain-containing protein-like isoform X2 [Brienomyrus brachyistius]
MKCLVQLILACVLFSEGDESCNGTEKSCPSSDYRCGRANYFENKGGTLQILAHSKACMEPSQCSSGSVSSGMGGFVYHAECCDSDLCNGEDHNVSISARPLNGLKCFTCLENMCTNSVDCLENEIFCMSATANFFRSSHNIKGCVSESLCPSRDVKIHLGPLLGMSMKCCKGELCNSGRRMEQRLPPALLAFLSCFTLLH